MSQRSPTTPTTGRNHQWSTLSPSMDHRPSSFLSPVSTTGASIPASKSAITAKPGDEVWWDAGGWWLPARNRRWSLGNGEREEERVRRGKRMGGDKVRRVQRF
ncbi:hypothetical protein RHMOL_Rhmol03G0262000 [Rhododendron molle]|uniref:Uncharacterized protein n=1 Tax=Rhododendron molle TaxID=49168 RepID=A0ACC0PID2_RHOML|nr:hypothetical protein RHMOL_Rhmol03G0262000 [Rhododendron molle]